MTALPLVICMAIVVLVFSMGYAIGNYQGYMAGITQSTQKRDYK